MRNRVFNRRRFWCCDIVHSLYYVVSNTVNISIVWERYVRNEYLQSWAAPKSGGRSTSSASQQICKYQHAWHYWHMLQETCSPRINCSRKHGRSIGPQTASVGNHNATMLNIDNCLELEHDLNVLRLQWLCEMCKLFLTLNCTVRLSIVHCCCGVGQRISIPVVLP